MQILVTGGSGTLGRRLLPALGRAGLEAAAPSHREMDVTDPGAVERVLGELFPAVVIHCAAVVRSRGANDPGAWAITSRVNVFGTGVVARACARAGTRLVYVSTDFVFDGSKPGGLYREDDLPSPIGPYALSKLAGESLALECPRALVVRTSFCADEGWPYPRAYVDRFTSKERASVVAVKLVRAATSDLVGTLHLGGPRRSYLDLARTLSPDVEPATLESSPPGHPVPIDTSLDTTRWRGRFFDS
ncbi:MAG: NAD(P)-dependent oxidoreductase [Deltaproteobacteria bacterium]|nr:NAD(P)-dependent oxidoreductase [Deltaproteobacteria bacterium]